MPTNVSFSAAADCVTKANEPKMRVSETVMPMRTILRSPKMSPMYQLRWVAALTPLKELRNVRALSSTPTPER